MKSQFANNRIAKNTVFLYIRMAIVMFASLYMSRVVFKVLGVEDYGLYNVVCGFVFLLNIVNLTISHGTLRYYNEEIGKNNNTGITDVFNSALRIQVLVVFIVILILETVGVWYINTKMVIASDRIDAANWIFQFSALSLIFVIMQAPFTSAIFAYERMDYYAIISIIDVSVKLGVAFIVQIIPFDKLVTYGALMLVVWSLNFILCSVYCFVQFKEIRVIKRSNLTMTKRMLSFAGWLVLEPIAFTMRGHGSNMVLNVFFGTIINAAYGISYQISASLDQFCSGISTAFKPQLMQSYSAGDYDRTKQLLYSMTKILFALKLMLCVPIIIEIKTLLELWLGDGFPQYALVFTILSVIVRIIDSLNQPLTTVIYATEKIKKYMIYTSSALFSTLPVSYLLFKFGLPPQSLFIAMIILTALSQWISIEIVNKQCSFFVKKEYLLGVVVPCVIHGVIIFATSLFVASFDLNNIFRLILVCFTSLLATIFSAFIIVFDSTEKEMVKSFFSRIIRNKGI